MKRVIIIITILFFGIQQSWTQAASDSDYQGLEAQSAVFIKKMDQEINLDGKLDEASWFQGSPAKDFWEYFPSDSSRSSVKTEIYMMFDDKNLYIGAICHSVGDNYVISSLKRDFRAGGNDNITFLIDPFQDRTNAFVFGMNPAGVRREALISSGGRSTDDWNGGWDNKWRGESHIGDGFWSCEMIIPLSTMRFKEGLKTWYFNSYRFDTQSSSNSTWNRIPQNQIIMSLAYMGKMEWEEAPKTPGTSITVIPYVSGRFAKDFEEGTPSDYGAAFGGDAKVAVSPSMNLDLTFNPDFSQVEVDQQVINTDRFEILFPERRQFFLENSDLFGSFGNQNINPFFSRRIGIGKDTADNNIQVPIVYGARLSGKLDKNWRLGLLNMQTLKDIENQMPNVNYTVAALQRKVFSRSNIGFIFVNKESFAKDEELNQGTDHNRVLGLDYNLASSDNKWNGKVFYHQAITTDDTYENYEKYAQGASLNYRERKFAVGFDQQWVRGGYAPEVGFLRRSDYFQVNPVASLFFYPKSKNITRHNLEVDFSTLWKPNYGKTDHEYQLNWETNFANTSEIRFSLSNQYTYLFDSFDPTRTDAKELPADTDYTYTDFSARYQSDQREKFSYEIGTRVGDFFNGARYGGSGGLTYRYQPYGSIEMNINYTYVDLPEPFASAGLFLIGPRIDLTFSKSLFLTTFIQYNNQVENLNINARLQWRFAPVSDFFLVYTDNYDTFDFGVKNRALVAKVTYWLNL
jgi:hypothetical protein